MSSSLSSDFARADDGAWVGLLLESVWLFIEVVSAAQRVSARYIVFVFAYKHYTTRALLFQSLRVSTSTTSYRSIAGAVVRPIITITIYVTCLTRWAKMMLRTVNPGSKGAIAMRSGRAPLVLLIALALALLHLDVGSSASTPRASSPPSPPPAFGLAADNHVHLLMPMQADFTTVKSRAPARPTNGSHGQSPLGPLSRGLSHVLFQPATVRAMTQLTVYAQQPTTAISHRSRDLAQLPLEWLRLGQSMALGAAANLNMPRPRERPVRSSNGHPAVRPTLSAAMSTSKTSASIPPLTRCAPTTGLLLPPAPACYRASKRHCKVWRDHVSMAPLPSNWSEMLYKSGCCKGTLTTQARDGF